MSEQPESTSPSSKTSGLWKTGTKGFNKMANAASNAAKTATGNFASVGNGLSSVARHKVQDDGEYKSDNEPSEALSSRDLTDSDHNPIEKSHNKNKNVFKKTYKTLRKGANKVNPLRIANAVVNPSKEGEEKTSIMSRLGTDEAEDAVLSSVERRSNLTKAGEDGFRPAVDGESPPFHVPTLGNAFSRAMTASKDTGDGANRKSGAPSLKMMTQKIMAMQRLERAAKMHQEASARASNNSDRQGHHRRARTLLDAIGNVKHDHDAQDDLLLGDGDDFRDFHKVFDADPNEMKEKRQEELINSSGRSGNEEQNDQSPNESLPLLGGDSGGSRDTTDSELQWRARQLLAKSQFKRFRELFNPLWLASKVGLWFLRSTLMLAIPLFVTAWILFYFCGNPSPPEFLPGTATLSWWFNFTGRQLVLFELARVTQFFMIDLLVLHTRFVSRTVGPWVTIFCLQSKGWPFIIGSWGLWALLLLQGSSKFDYHWLYFTGIRIYSSGNSGSYIISSVAYLRILLSMVIIGVFTTLKRTLSTLYFGRRMFDAYKPRLEEILNDIILISEIAELSVESGNIASVIGVEKKEKSYDPPQEINAPEMKTVNRGGRIRWSSVKFEESPLNRSGSQSGLLSEHEDVTDAESQMTDDGSTSQRSPYFDSNSSRIPLKGLLDKWQEPVSKKDKTINATVNDILKFRQALTYMDLDFPFSEAFGRASTRNEMILSAEVVYNRLMHLSPEPDILSFSVFKILLLQEDGEEDTEKRRALRNIFRPDRNDNLPLLSFVQTCDTVYKKLRYFRASVGNASVIDQVLESIIDVVFYFTLGLVVLSLLNLNPWPLLVSMSTLLVTASFAVGPSCAKAIEGILLIVGRRPFDIGDRVIITDTPGAAVPTMGSSWFVEDISLFSTTLRFAASNEIATVSNGSLANARITNCARSMNATVHTLLKFHISCHQGRVLQEYKSAVENFVQENPNIWDSILFFRLEDIDSNNEVVTYRLAVRSRFTWQISNRVFQSQADMHKFCIALSFKMGINYDAPNPRTIMYFGGSLLDGGVQDYKANVLQNDNITNDNDVLTGLVPKDMVLPVMRGASQTSVDEEEKAPRFAQSATELRAIEQQIQDSNDDEMEGQDVGKNMAEDEDEAGMSTAEEADAKDANQAFLNLLQKSHGP